MIDLGRVRLGYSGIRIYSGIYSGYSAPGSRIAGMEIQVFRNENSSQTNPYLHYSNYSYSGLILNERALSITEDANNACPTTVVMVSFHEIFNIFDYLFRYNSYKIKYFW